MNTSVMSPVDSRVLTMLSPSPPCGRVSTLTVMFGVLRGEGLGQLLGGLDVLLGVVDEERERDLAAAAAVVAGAETAALQAVRASERRPARRRPVALMPGGSSSDLQGDASVSRAGRSDGAGRRRAASVRAAGPRPRERSRVRLIGVDQLVGAARRGSRSSRRGELAASSATTRGLRRRGDDGVPAGLVVDEVADRRLGGQRGVVARTGRRRPLVRAVADLDRLALAGHVRPSPAAPTGTVDAAARAGRRPRPSATAASPYGVRCRAAARGQARGRAAAGRRSRGSPGAPGASPATVRCSQSATAPSA